MKQSTLVSRLLCTYNFYTGWCSRSTVSTAEVALYIKAAARDVRAFRDARGYRKIPVGYSNADESDINPFIQYYLSCGGNPNETVEFFAYNNYAWVRILCFFYQVSQFSISLLIPSLVRKFLLYWGWLWHYGQIWISFVGEIDVVIDRRES